MLGGRYQSPPLAGRPAAREGVEREHTPTYGDPDPDPLNPLLTMFAGGKWRSVADLLGDRDPQYFVSCLGDLLDDGYALDRIRDRLRLRPRRPGEPRQLLLDVIGGLDLASRPEVGSDEAEGESEPAEGDDAFDPGADAGTATAAPPPSGAPAGGLVLSDPPVDLTLPCAILAGFTGTVLAKRGAGKTYLAGVLFEEVAAAGVEQQLLVLDPGGVWWGVGLDAGGRETAARPVLVVGGPMGHAKLCASDGGRVADLVRAVRPSPAVVDLSELAPVEQHRVAADLLERLWSFGRYPLILVVDEADELAPKKFGALPEHQRRSRDALDRLALRGRARGCGFLAVSLRPAVLSNNILSQSDYLWLLRTTQPHDLRAVGDWLGASQHSVGSRERSRCLAQLPVLPSGAAYVLRGGDEPLFRRFRVRPKRTYDSSRTGLDPRLAGVAPGRPPAAAAAAIEAYEAGRRGP